MLCSAIRKRERSTTSSVMPALETIRDLTSVAGSET